MNTKNSEQTHSLKPVTGAAYIAALVGEGLFDDCPHYEVAAVQESYDNATCHVALHVLTNHCGALLDALMRLSPYGLTITGVHRLHGSLEGGLELDVTINPRPARPRRASPFTSVPMDNLPPSNDGGF